MKFLNKRNKTCGFIAICFVLMLSYQIVSVTSPNDSKTINTQENPKISAQISDTEYDWLNNSGFDTSEYWYSQNNTDTLNPDVNASISNGFADFEILGNVDTKIIDDPLNDGTWHAFTYSNFRLPEDYGIDSRGCWVTHEWDEDEDQTHNYPIIHWKKNVSMGFDMSDYNITSASLEVMFNASVGTNVDTENDDDSGGSGNWQYSIGDFVEFYVELSDIYGTNPYRVRYNKTYNLGQDGISPQITTIEEKPIEPQGDEDDLISALNSAFEGSPGHSNFNITLGITIYCEDNDPNIDVDTYDPLIIRSCNLSFTYEKLIDEFNSISWNQDANKLSDLSPGNDTSVVATEANLKFKYTIDKNWTTNTGSQNSEINIYLNRNPYPIPIKLIHVNVSDFEQEADLNLIPPVDSVNLSIEILIKDDFGLDDIITISIDNVTLDISYIIYFDIPHSGGDGGGGGTKIIRGEDYTPIVIGLVAGIIGLIAVFGAYQAHFKHPLMVRKIRKLKKKIKKGKTLKSLAVNPREEIIRDNFKAKTRQALDEEFLQPEVLGKMNKIKEQGGGK